MKKNQLFFFVCLVLVFGLSACNQTPSNIAEGNATATPVVEPVPVLTPTPDATPVPSPVPQGPGYELIRSNKEIMNQEQIEKYGDDLTGKEVEGWVGNVFKVLDNGDGTSRVILDMEQPQPEGQLPDVILEKIPSAIAQQFKPGQSLNFSGTIQGFVDIPECVNQLTMDHVRIFGFTE